MNPHSGAFPFHPHGYTPEEGMSLRTYVATAALQGILSAYSAPEVKLPDAVAAAKMAVEYTDALLQKLERA